MAHPAARPKVEEEAVPVLMPQTARPQVPRMAVALAEPALAPKRLEARGARERLDCL